MQTFQNIQTIVNKWIVLSEHPNNPFSQQELYYIGSTLSTSNEPYYVRLQKAGFSPDDFHNLKPVTKLNADTVAEILSNELEDQNRHKLCRIFPKVKDTIRETAYPHIISDQNNLDDYIISVLDILYKQV